MHRPRTLRRLRHRGALVVVLLALAGVLAACGQGASAGGSSSAGGGFAEPTPAPPQPSTSWYFADSWTGEGFSTLLTMRNPGAQATYAAVTFLGTDGSVTERGFPLAAGAESTIDLGDLLGRDLIRAHRVVADQPIVVTHTITNGRSGVAVPGATTEATRWRLTENRPTASFDKWIELANFGDAAALVGVEYAPATGTGEVKRYTVPAHALLLIHVNEEFPRGIGRWTIVVENRVPIVVEMTAYDHGHNIVLDQLGEPRR